MECSIIVLTYNSQLEKILQTLNSILNQHNLQKIEIVISDDGSKYNNFKEIETFFFEHAFKNYKLVPNEYNKGTVENFYAGAKVAAGRYIKAIGCGDLLFEKETIVKICEFMDEGNKKICFGLLKAFNKNGEGITYRDCNIPMDLKAFKDKNQKKINRNIITWGKLISGASLFFERDCLIKLLKEIRGKVKFCEDYIQIIALVKEIQIYFFDENVVWYEIRDGISTSKDPVWEKRIKQDYDTLFIYMEQKYYNNKYVSKRVTKQRLGRYPRLLRGIIKFLIDPGMFLIPIRTSIQKKQGLYNGKNIKGFLNEV